MVRRICFFLLIFFITLSNLHAFNIRLEVDGILPEKNGIFSATVQDAFTLKVIFEGNQPIPNTISVPGIEKLSVQRRGNSRNIAINNGSMVAHTTLVFDVTPREIGTITLGPVQLESGGSKATSNVVTIKVEEPESLPANPADDEINKLLLKQYQRNGHGFVARLSLDKNQIIVGEPVTLTLEIRSTNNVVDQRVAPLTFQDGTVQSSDHIARAHTTVHNIPITILKKRYSITPSSPGTKTITALPIVYQAQQARKTRSGGFFDEHFFGSIFGNLVEERQATTNAISFTVDPLPTNQGSIDGVGFFTSLTASVQKNSVYVNEPIVFTLTLAGSGNLDQIPHPLLKLPQNITAYTSKSHVSVKNDMHIKSFEYIVQANKSGEQIIPPQKFSFYDTTSKSVKTLKTEPITLHATLPEGEEDQTPRTPQSKKEQTPSSSLKTHGSDIHFIEEEHRKHTTQQSQPYAWWLFFFILFLIPCVVYANRLMYYVNIIIRKLWLKRKRSLPRFELYQKALKTLEEKDTLNLLHAFFLQVLADNADIPAKAIHTFDIERFLHNQGWDIQQIQRFMAYMNDCASISYASDKAGTLEKQELISQARYWLLLLNNRSSKEHKDSL